MTEITPKQLQFCLAYIDTGNASEAYRVAYKADRMKDATIKVEASRLLATHNVAEKIAELRAVVIERAEMTLGKHLEDLRSLREEARTRGAYSAAITAEISRGKAAGFYTEKHSIAGDPENPIITKIVREIVDVPDRAPSARP